MNKLKNIISGVLIGLLLTGGPALAINSGISSPSYFKKIGNAVLFNSSNYTLGGASNRIDGYFDDLDATTLVVSGAASGDLDMNGNALILDADGNTSVEAATDDQIDVTVGGALDFQILANLFKVLSGSAVWADDSATVGFGNTPEAPDLKIYSNGTDGIIEAVNDFTFKVGSNLDINLGDGATNANVKLAGSGLSYMQMLRGATLAASMVAQYSYDHFGFGSVKAETGYNFYFSDYLNVVLNPTLGTQNDPTLWVGSSDDVRVSNNRIGGLVHDGDDFYIKTRAATGSGTAPATITNCIALAPQSGEVLRSCVDKIVFSTNIQRYHGPGSVSASNLDISPAGNSFDVTGITQVNCLNASNKQDGTEIRLFFTDSLTVADSQACSGDYASINLAGSLNFSATADDNLTVELRNGEWYEVARTAI